MLDSIFIFNMINITQCIQHSRAKTSDDKKQALELMKQLNYKKNSQENLPWKHSNNHNYLFENEVKMLNTTTLTNTEIVKYFHSLLYMVNPIYLFHFSLMVQYRIHLIPRSYDKTIPDGKPSSFKLTSNFCEEFGGDLDKLQTKTGMKLTNGGKQTQNV